MTTTNNNLPLGSIHDLAADMIDLVGWCQGNEMNGAGAVSLTGALKVGAENPGDWLLAREIFRRNSHAEVWNDNPERTAEQVVTFLRTAKITDVDMELKFGPQWTAVANLVRRAASLSLSEREALLVAYDNANENTWSAACSVVDSVVRQNLWRGTAGYSAGAAVSIAVWEVSGSIMGPSLVETARNATKDRVIVDTGSTAKALAVRHLIGQFGFTQTHYDVLADPWTKVVGLIHPDDEMVKKFI